MFDFLNLSIGLPGYVALLVLVAFAAGTMGALLGFGGGILMVPALILLFGVEPHLAVAASLLSVLATSVGSASTYVATGLADLRLGMFLEPATVVGGLAGAFVSVVLLANHGQALVLAFVPVVLVAAVIMYRTRQRDTQPDAAPDRWSDRLRLRGTYYDERRREWVEYRVTRAGAGLALAGAGGVVSGLLGIGGGIFNVPAMNSLMNVPIRVAGGTSNFIIGITASAGALIYYFGGDVAVALTAPVALGALAGSSVGGQLHRIASAVHLKGLFVGVLFLAAGVLLLRGVGVL